MIDVEKLNSLTTEAEMLAHLPALPICYPSGFAQRPRIELVAIEVMRRNWRFKKVLRQEKGIKLLTHFIYWSSILQRWVVEVAGTISDGATVPRILWWFYPPFGNDDTRSYLLAAIGHDKYCREGAEGKSPISYKDAAALFGELMGNETLTRVRVFMTRGVLWFGPKFTAVTPL